MTQHQQRDWRTEFSHEWSAKDEAGYMAQVRAWTKKEIERKFRWKEDEEREDEQTQ